LTPNKPAGLRPQINWANPDYSETILYRAQALELLRKSPGSLKGLREYYSTHWIEFINDWMSTYDPRNVGTDKPVTMPFILFPRQEDFVNWVFERWQKQERGLGSKTRDVGFSWLAGACAVCLWLFYPESSIGIGSRKMELVDNGNVDKKSLFWKIRKIIETLPVEFIPANYGEGNKWGVVSNPENGASIVGEVGDNIGAGDRTTIYFVDEADLLEHPMQAEVGLAQTTNCRIDISATYNVGSVFYNNERSLPSDQVFTFDWVDDPRKRLNPHLPQSQEPWYLQQLKELDPTVVASQVDRNPAQAIANTYIETSLVTDAFKRQVTDIQQRPDTPWMIGVDASGMGNDENVIWRRRGRLSLPLLPVPKQLDGPQLAAWVERAAKELLKSGPVGLIGIERDGPGGSCADQLKYGPFASVMQAVHTGIKLKDGMHYNLRAYLHAQALDYLKEEYPYIPYDATFLAQATSILRDSHGGMLLMESKDKYRTRLSGLGVRANKYSGRSPDRLDGFILTFMPTKGKPITSLSPSINKHLGLNTQHSWKPLDAAFGW